RLENRPQAPPPIVNNLFSSPPNRKATLLPTQKESPGSGAKISGPAFCLVAPLFDHLAKNPPAVQGSREHIETTCTNYFRSQRAGCHFVSSRSLHISAELPRFCC